MTVTFDILEPYAGGFTEVLRKINQELAKIENDLQEEALEKAVENDLNMLMEKYLDQIQRAGRSPDKIRQKYLRYLVERRTESLKDARDKLEKLKAEVLSVAPPSIFRRDCEPQTLLGFR